MYFDRQLFQKLAIRIANIMYCADCSALPTVLVEHGYFPSAPVHPPVAFSFDVLEHHTYLTAQHMTPVSASKAALVHLLNLHGVTLEGQVR